MTVPLLLRQATIAQQRQYARSFVHLPPRDSTLDQYLNPADVHHCMTFLHTGELFGIWLALLSDIRRYQQTEKQMGERGISCLVELRLTSLTLSGFVEFP